MCHEAPYTPRTAKNYPIKAEIEDTRERGLWSVDQVPGTFRIVNHDLLVTQTWQRGGRLTAPVAPLRSLVDKL